MDINNKKDDSKATAILQMGEKRKIPIRYLSKHDLNMMVESRPHQGFILHVETLSAPNVISLPQTDNFK